MSFSSDETPTQRVRRLALLGYRRAMLRRIRPRPFIMLTTSRSGSTWACDILSRVVSCGNVPEHIRPEHLDAVMQGRTSPGALADYGLRVLRELDRGRVGGTKVIWDDIPDVIGRLSLQDGDRLLAALRDLSPVIIRLRRDDLLSQAISRYLARESGNYHRYRAGVLPALSHGSRPAPTGREQVPYNLPALKHHVEVLQAAEKHLDSVLQSSDMRPLELLYEQLVDGPEATLEPVFQALLCHSDAGDIWRGRLTAALSSSKLMRDRDPRLDAWRRALEQELPDADATH